MATEQAINIITGHTGQAHVSSADDAAIWSGLVSGDKITLKTGANLNLNYSTAGQLRVYSGVVCINGHMGRVNSQAVLDCPLPATGYYRRTLVIVRYSNTAGIESMKLMVLQNNTDNDVTDAANAADLNITTGSNDYILYDFVCDEHGVVSDYFQKKLIVNDSLSLLEDRVKTIEQNRNRQTILWERSENDTFYRRGDGILLRESVTNFDLIGIYYSPKTFFIPVPSNTGIGYDNSVTLYDAKNGVYFLNFVMSEYETVSGGTQSLLANYEIAFEVYQGNRIQLTRCYRSRIGITDRGVSGSLVGFASHDDEIPRIINKVVGIKF